MTIQPLLIYFFLSLFPFWENEKPTIFLIGDSTCANKNAYDAPETGWGMPFSDLFTDAIKVENYAVNGRSTKSFRTLGHWEKVEKQLKKGDYVLIQFGHNDSKESDTTRYAAPRTDYRNNLIRYIEEIQEKGAIPVLITPVMRRKFDENGKFIDQHGEYPSVVREVAKQYHLTLIDLTESSQKTIEQAGVEGSKKMFMHYVGGIFPKFPKGIDDDTHFSVYGAKNVANLVADGLVKQGSPLRNFLKKTDFQDKYFYELPTYYTPVFRKDTFNIVRYGAKAGGQFLNTDAINQAILRANEAGGGTVLIPDGLWLTGPIVLKSNINLHISQNAVVQFSRNYDHYPIVATTWEGEDAYRCQAPISGKNLENIALTGEGLLDGGGDVWRAIGKNKQTESEWERLIASGGVLNDKKDKWFPSEKSLKGSLLENGSKISNGKTAKDYEDVKDFLRPNMLSLVSCKNILIEGINLQNSPAWTMHPLLCEDISIRNVKVRNYWYAQNSDAIDLESCKNGVLENCTFDTGDDGITIKSGRDEQGRKRGVPTENFIIKNCKVYHAHGGFVIGSEMSGGVRNLYVSNCTFSGTDIGLRFKTARGRGGIVENIYVNDIQMTNIIGESIIFDMYYAAKDPVLLVGDNAQRKAVLYPEIKPEPVTDATPQFRNIYLKNIYCKGAGTALKIRGLPEMKIKNISIENAVLEAKKGFICIEAENIFLKKVQIIAQEKEFIQHSKNVVRE